MGAMVIMGITGKALRLTVFGALLITLSGCSVLKSKSTRAQFDGNFYPAKVERDDSDRTRFRINVSDASQGMAGAREAARYEATKYCIAQYGNSQLQWVVGPDAPDSALRVQDDTVSFQGACEGW